MACLNQSQKIAYNQSAAGGDCKRRPYEMVEITYKDVPSVQQAVPIKVFYGRAKLTGVFIVPVWNVYGIAICEKISGGK
jgi:hypothetical protein